MKKLISITLVITFLLLTPSNAFAVGSTDTVSSSETFSFVSENEDIITLASTPHMA